MKKSKVRMVNGMDVQLRGERVTGFITNKKVVGTESVLKTINRLKLTPEKGTCSKLQTKFIMSNGVPCKRVNGKLVPLTLKK